MGVQTIMKRPDSFCLGVLAYFAGIILTEVLFVTLHPSSVSEYLIYQVPILIGGIWGGCWNIYPELGRLSDGARSAPSLRKLDHVTGIAVISVIGSYAGPLDVENVALEVFHVVIQFPSLVYWVSASVILAAFFSLGIVALISRRMEYPVYPRPLRGWSVRRGFKAASFIMLFVGAWSMTLRQYVLAGLSLFLAGAIVRLTDRVGGNKISMLTRPPQVALPPPVNIETGKVAFERRFSIGKKISDMIIQKHGKKILAVCMWGLSADETEESVSYLDVAAVVKSGQGSIPDKKFVYDGVEVTVTYWPESAFIARAREVDEGWPAYRSRFSSLKVLYEREGWTRHVHSALAESDKGDTTEAIRNVALDIVRHVGILNDDLRKRDMGDIREDCSNLATSNIILLLLLNHKPWPSGDFRRGISDILSKPADMQSLLDLASGSVSATQGDMVAATLKLTGEMLEMVRLRGIAIQESALTV
jgi:hypothetical protein